MPLSTICRGYSLTAGQLKVNPFMVSLSNHGRINHPPFDKALLSSAERLRANS
ncbi:protein of unknown function [Methylotuvimicrobium alcaliphilum 20Z]|uniref:Uncharacterized protein n=1 Tax=Methylotuvimicrobium alcaliphilum (strain DSM 19304 / NCIMB 14124 / VKM B-2133 / 20Z) TaxID=1091494 RepID=G4SXQ4_META2|nr:protein of unknown function [Methylotuvimicrobium alcaliphilum 20Z]